MKTRKILTIIFILIGGALNMKGYILSSQLLLFAAICLTMYDIIKKSSKKTK